MTLRPEGESAGHASSASAKAPGSSTKQHPGHAKAQSHSVRHAGAVALTKQSDSVRVAYPEPAIAGPLNLHEQRSVGQPVDYEALGRAVKPTPKPKNRWIDMGRKVRVYVYDLKALKNINKDLTVDPQQVPNFGFEMVFRKLLQESRLHRTTSPEKADFYYVPVDLCSIRATWWQRQDKVQHMQALDESVVAALRKVGPYWDTRNDRHIVSSCRCPKVNAGTDALNPELWGRNTTMRLCLQTRVTGQHGAEDIDTKRSLHVGYHVPGLETRLARGRRSTLAVYMGYPMNLYRERVASWMHESCTDCTSFELEKRANLPEALQEKYHKALRHARFSIEPPGETLERMSRDASILAGAVPVIFELPEGRPQQSLPWFPVLNWSRFSVNFTLTPEEAQGTTSFVPRLEEKLRALVDSGEADRLQRGVMEAREKVTWTENGALETVMGMLAWRKAGMPGVHREG